MKLLGVGGGSGGHVTPVLAVINELQKIDQDLECRFVSDKGFLESAKSILSHAETKSSIRVSSITAGKFRRYNGLSLIDQLKNVRTNLLNLRDVFFIIYGFLQSVILLIRWRPDLVFTKGGFVCVPVAVAARLLRIPIVMHDSDAMPGLANVITSRWASAIATGSDLDNYNYNKQISTYTGTPVDASFVPFDAKSKNIARSELQVIDPSRPLIVVTGGGLGAKRLNDSLIDISQELINHGYSVYHVTGAADYDRINSVAPDSVHYQVVSFVSSGMAKVFGAADLVVLRAGMTSLLEAAAMHKATIIVPNDFLPGGHQTKNANVFANNEAAIVVNESEYDRLLSTIDHILTDPALRASLENKIGQLARPDAARDVARIIYDTFMTHNRAERSVDEA